MESFLNGRNEQPKVGVAVKKRPGLEMANMHVPEPGSANQADEDSPELHTVCEGENTPTVQLLMENDEVKKILIKCTCGQNIELSCESMGARLSKS